MTLLVSACGLLIGAAIGALVAWARLSGHCLRARRASLCGALPRPARTARRLFRLFRHLDAADRRSRNLVGLRGFRRRARRSSPARSRSASSPAPIRRKCSAPPISPSRRGELEAAVSVGMSRLLMFRRIIAPQVLRFALPGLGNLWQVALKDSSLISVTGLTELMRVSQIGAGSTHQPFAFYLGGMALYLVMTLISTRAVRRRRGARDPRHAPRGGVRRDGLGLHRRDLHAAARRRAADARGLGAVGDPRRDRRRGRDVDAGQRLEAARDRSPAPMSSSSAARRCSSSCSSSTTALRRCRPSARASSGPSCATPSTARVLSLALCTAAYQAEIFRGALLAVPHGQVEAARACGMSRLCVPPHHLPDRAAARAAGLLDRDDLDGEGDGARLA